MKSIKQKIKKESGFTFNGFPKSDFDKIKDLLSKNIKVEIWLLRGMGRYYLKGFLPNENNSNLPTQEKLCDLINEEI